MDEERLEWALRRLPGVLACSLDGDTVTLLLDPHASVLDVEAAANTLLLGAGDVRPPLLLGGTRPVIVPSRARFDVVPIVKAAGPGLIAVGAAALVATLVASPAAFWRDSITPSAPSAVGAAPSSPGHRGVTELSQRPSQLASDVAAPVPAPAPVTDRRLVLLVPQLPSAPIQNISAVTSAVSMVGDKASVAGSDGSAASVKGSAGTPTPPTDASAPSVKARGAGRPQSEGVTKHGGKHGEKDEQGHGEKGWGKTRREQVRSQKARGSERSSASARAQRRGHDDD